MTTEITWHPYPKEKPPKTRQTYLVSAYRGGELVVFEDFYGEFDDAMTFALGCQVVAWAEMPKAYTP